MGCGCGKKGTPSASASPAQAKSGQYALTLPDGKRTFYNTQSEAIAANKAAGGKGLIRRVS